VFESVPSQQHGESQHSLASVHVVEPSQLQRNTKQSQRKHTQ
jgi:hypothetical protein